MEPEQIPLDLNLMRYAYGEPATDRLAVYSIDSLNTNWMRPCFAIIDRYSDDIAGALEGTLHTILDAGYADEDVYRIMGLVKEDELDEDTLAEGNYTPIDLGYCIEGNILSFEMVDEEVASPSKVLTDRQFSQFERAIDHYGISFPDAMRLVRHDYDAWQGRAICIACDMGLPSETLDEICDPAFSGTQMSVLSRIAADGIDIAPFSDPALDAKRMDAAYHVYERGGNRLNLPYEALSLAQLRTLVNILDARKFPLEDLVYFAKPAFSPENMELIATALNGYKSDPLSPSSREVARALNPAFSDEQQVALFGILRGGTDASRLSTEEFCQLFVPSDSVEKISAVAYGVNEKHLSASSVSLFVKMDLSPMQLMVIFDALDSASRGEVDKSLPGILAASPQLSSQQMAELLVDAQYGMPASSLKEKALSLQKEAPEEASHAPSLSSEARDALVGKDALSEGAPDKDSYSLESEVR